jgi:alpha-1,3-glucan synthase
MRNAAETEEVCSIFNISDEISLAYVKYDSSFNLLHSASSYIRLFQNGFGVVGVSKDYGERCRARYPIFWGLSKIDGLPNPDPTDSMSCHDGLPRVNMISNISSTVPASDEHSTA